jgi:hypothetical protein
MFSFEKVSGVISKEVRCMSRGDNESVPRADYYLLMLKVNSEKEVVPVNWSPVNLDENSAALIIDELMGRLYMWIGESVDGITKAVARRKAADVASQGYKLENVSYPIGKLGTKKLEIIEINQADMTKDTKMKDTFGEVKNLFRKKGEILEGGVLARANVKVPEAKRELSEGFVRAPPKFQEVSKALEEKFGRASEIIAERETMRERYKGREDDKIAALYMLAFTESLGGKVETEIAAGSEGKVYRVTKKPTAPSPKEEQTEGGEQKKVTADALQEKRFFFAVEGRRMKVVETNLTQEELGKVMRTAEDLS